MIAILVLAWILQGSILASLWTWFATHILLTILLCIFLA